MNANKIAFQTENERLLEKLGGKVRSFDGWKLTGKFVRRGEKQKAFRVQSGTRGEMNPITGETYATPIFKMAYGFTAEQVS